ncbi:hypothetical protein [Variovorax ginsengisoli]|uniref:Uncharacterized protein n=1 Tax=Variovorax ginsengisoli TaxID=363844 RepID=A0ABT8SFJ2_9BURK|nr:hypothetical protein [Variovorax ginsengisoli]MDN8617939.1 hypothetical protein [Variovorax ginsengisoli]MDO1537109.1 hypothetical protein [Variovorax ginsengisoli]
MTPAALPQHRQPDPLEGHLRPSGGSADVVGRLLVISVATELGQSVIVDNRA